MDLFFAFLSILVISLCTWTCIMFALQRHHQREMEALQQSINEQHMRFQLMNTMLDKNMLPPGMVDSLKHMTSPRGNVDMDIEQYVRLRKANQG